MATATALSPYQKAVNDVRSYPDDRLLAVWEALKGYDPSDNRDGLPMDDWAELVKSEIDQRGL